jgi:hypothetical protein
VWTVGFGVSNLLPLLTIASIIVSGIKMPGEKVWNGMSCQVSPEKSNLLAQKQHREEYRREGQRREE